MAKLNVKVIGMENGEVTEIERYGTRYVKTEENAQEGDIGLRVSSSLPGIATIGDYYDLKGLHLDFLGDAEYWYVDDSGDRVHGRKENFVVFRKVEQPTTEASDLEPSLDARVTELEERVDAIDVRECPAKHYRKISREPQEGDYVKFSDEPTDFVHAEKFYEIIRVDSLGDPHIIDEDGDDFDTCSYGYELYELVETEVEKVSGVKVESEPKVGDRVEILPNHPFMLDATQMSGEIINTESVARGKYDVKIDNYSLDLSFKPNEIRVISQADHDPRKAFENGEKVRLVSGGGSHGLFGMQNGNIYTVNNVENDGGHKGRIAVGCGYAKPEQLEKVSSEELAEIERKKTEEKEIAKWTKIGRKPNEFKEGDIVRVDWIYKKGEVDELVEIDRGPDGSGLGGNYYLTNGEGTLGNHIVELITPVENRFDLAD